MDTSAEGDDVSRPRNASPFIVYDTTPTVVKKTTNGKVSYETTFHFRVPGSLITTDSIHMIGLYANNVYAGNEAQASAYYLLTERDTENRLC